MKIAVPLWIKVLAATLTVSLAVLYPFASASEPEEQPAAQKAPVRVPDGEWCGVCVIDLDTGMPLVWQNVERPYVPASVTKAVTAAAVIALRDSNECILTEVYTTAPIDSGGIVRGNLVVEVAGDPTLDGTFPREVTRALKDLNIKQITGRVVVDTLRAFRDSSVPRGWEPNDVATSYGRPLHAATYKRNTTSRKITRTVKAKTGKGKKRRTRSRKVTSTAAVTNLRPDTTLRNDLRAALKEAGIQIGGASGMGGSKRLNVVTHKSLRLADILKTTMWRSDNLYAEGMLRRLAQGDTRAEALAEELDFLTDPDGKIHLKGVVLNDGSGLSRDNRITPLFLAELLMRMADDPAVGATYVRLFPRVGREGTVRRLLADTPLEGRLALKSGTMRDVVSYAGYAFLDDNNPLRPTHVVVMMANRFPGSRAGVRAAMSRMLLDLFAPESSLREEPEGEGDEIVD